MSIATFTAYYEAGWQPLPLPPRKKVPPPTAFTGKKGHTRDSAEYLEAYARWSSGKGLSDQSNIALRLDPHTVGIDVDHYGDKTGGDTLDELEQELGALPETVIVTSRDDGISGIRLFRVEGSTDGYRDHFDDIEIIRASQRFLVAPGSIHPGHAASNFPPGATYLATDQRTGEVTTSLPAPSSLPMLPASWEQALTKGFAKAHRRNRSKRGSKAARSTGGRHDAMVARVWAMVHAGETNEAITSQLRDPFIESVADRDTPAEAGAEFDRALDGARTKYEDELNQLKETAMTIGLDDALAVEVARLGLAAGDDDADFIARCEAYLADPGDARWRDDEGTDYSGGLKRHPRRGVLIKPSERGEDQQVSRAPFDLVARLVDTDGETVGWRTVLKLRDGPVYGLLRPSDLVGDALAKWSANNEQALLARPGRGQFAAWVRWRSERLPVEVEAHAGTNRIGDTLALIGTDSSVLWSSGVLTASPWVDQPQDLKLTTSGATCAESAAVVAQILGFRDLTESVPALSAMVALALPDVVKEKVGRPLSIVSIPGQSGTAKTSWTQLASRLAGYTGSATSDVTKAGLARMVTSGLIAYVDDLNKSDQSDQILAELRGKATGGDRKIADRNNDARIVSQKMRSGLLLTWESDFLGGTRAELDRRVIIPFTDTRVSERCNPDGSKQWDSMLALGADSSEPADVAIVNRHAANLLVGVCEAMTAMPRDQRWAGASGKRELVPVFAVQAVGRAISAWLGDNGQAELADEVWCLIDAWAEQECERRVQVRKSGADLSVVKALQAYLGSDSWTVGARSRAVDTASPENIRGALVTALKGAHTKEPFPVVAIHVGDDPRVLLAVATTPFHAWMAGASGKRARVEEFVGARSLSAKEIGEQLAQLPSPTGAEKVRLDTRVVVDDVSVRVNPTYQIVWAPEPLGGLLGRAADSDAA